MQAERTPDHGKRKYQWIISDIECQRSGTIAQAASTSISTAGTLTLFSGSGTIGVSGASILTNAPNLIANTTGNVYVSDSAATTIAGASTGAIFSLTDTASSGGSITVGSSNTMTASGALTLQAGTNGGIAVNANLTGSSVTLNANG